MTLVQGAISELKAGLSGYLAQVRAGEVIEVTSHNKPVARLVGIPAADAKGLARLLATGAAQWPGGTPALRPAVALSKSGRTMSELIGEDRG